MTTRNALSLIELILALIILGLVAALTIPRLTRAAEPPDEPRVLRDRLKVLRVAIERYYQDHGTYPAQRSDGRHPAGSDTAFVAQLTRFTDERGQVSRTLDATHRFGPYLRDGIPPCPVSPRAGCDRVHVVRGTAPVLFAPHASVAGWIYNCDTGRIAPNSPDLDSRGRAFATY